MLKRYFLHAKEDRTSDPSHHRNLEGGELLDAEISGFGDEMLIEEVKNKTGTEVKRGDYGSKR